MKRLKLALMIANRRRVMAKVECCTECKRPIKEDGFHFTDDEGRKFCDDECHRDWAMNWDMYPPRRG